MPKQIRFNLDMHMHTPPLRQMHDRGQRWREKAENSEDHVEGKWYRPKAQTPWRTMKGKSEKAQRMNPGYYQAPKTLMMDEDGLRVPRKDR